ncbi:MAG: ribosome small subunit-dependent GTPase A [Oscillospiraceae bacterium]
MNKILDGIIIKGNSGFYYVEAANEVFECKPRGIFRKDKITPLAGDFVKISINDLSENTIDEILPRKNFLTRPPVANIDNLIIVVSTTKPTPSTLIIDRLIALSEYKGIEPVLVFTKDDLKSSDEMLKIYSKSGIKTIVTSIISDDGLPEIKDILKGKISAFTGNSGVGKTTILNKLDNTLSLATAEISDKLGRGKHTTRIAELFKVCGGYIADTAGFSSLEFEKLDIIRKDELPSCFREFNDYLGKCKFSTCAHINDKGCKIVEAVEKGEINKSRHNSYVAMYNDVKDLKEWKL